MAPIWTSLVQRDGSTDGGDGGGIQMSTGAIVGIACGAGALFLGSLILFTVYWRRQKRYDAEDALYETTGEDARFTSSNTAPVYTLDYKGNEVHDTTSFTTSPQTAHTAHSGFTPLIEMASAMPAHPAYIPRALVRDRGTPSTLSPSSGSTSQFSSIHSRQPQQKTDLDDTVSKTFTGIGPGPNERKTGSSYEELEEADTVPEPQSRYGHQRRPSANAIAPAPIPVPMPTLAMPSYSTARRKQYSPPRLNLNTHPPQSKYINTTQPISAAPLPAAAHAREKVPISAVDISGPLVFPPQPPPPPPPPLQLGGPRQQQEQHDQYQKELEYQLQLEQQQQQQDQRYNYNNNNYYEEYSSADNYSYRTGGGGGGGGGGPQRGRSFRDRSLSSRGGTSRSRSNRGADRDRYYHSSSSNNGGGGGGGGGRQGQQYQQQQQRYRQETHYEEVELGKDSDDDIW